MKTIKIYSVCYLVTLLAVWTAISSDRFKGDPGAGFSSSYILQNIKETSPTFH